MCVNALGGQPGIYSARWAGPEKDFLFAAEKIHEKLLEKGADDYSAYFICVLAVSWPDGDHKVFKGRVDGTLSFPPAEITALVMILFSLHWVINIHLERWNQNLNIVFLTETMPLIYLQRSY